MKKQKSNKKSFEPGNNVYVKFGSETLLGYIEAKISNTSYGVKITGTEMHINAHVKQLTKVKKVKKPARFDGMNVSPAAVIMHASNTGGGEEIPPGGWRGVGPLPDDPTLWPTFKID